LKSEFVADRFAIKMPAVLAVARSNETQSAATQRFDERPKLKTMRRHEFTLELEE
jgi:hypothetical protein